MKESLEQPGYGELLREIEVLRQNIKELERRTAGRVEASLPRRQRPSRAAVMSVLGVVLCLTLGLSLLGAQSPSHGDALFINQSGSVGINQPNPEAPLDVNGNAIVRDRLNVKGTILDNPRLPAEGGLVAGDADLYFTGTRHNHSGQGNQTGFAAIENASNYDALMILGRNTKTAGRVIGLWDKVGIGMRGCNNQGCDVPQAMLDVRGNVKATALSLTGNLTTTGEIKGKLWRSQEYLWAQNGQNQKLPAATRMTAADRSVCFLTSVAGKYMGQREKVYIFENGGYWYLGGDSQQQDVRATAICIGSD